MEQHAIIFTKDNADIVAADLIEYTGPELLEEYAPLLNTFNDVVLVKDVLDRGASVLSYVVTGSVFEANTMPVAALNDKTFTFIRTV